MCSQLFTLNAGPLSDRSEKSDFQDSAEVMVLKGCELWDLGRLLVKNIFSLVSSGRGSKRELLGGLSCTALEYER